MRLAVYYFDIGDLRRDAGPGHEQSRNLSLFLSFGCFGAPGRGQTQSTSSSEVVSLVSARSLKDLFPVP